MFATPFDVLSTHLSFKMMLRYYCIYGNFYSKKLLKLYASKCDIFS